MTAGINALGVWTLGINHESAPLDVRARFAFASEQLRPVLKALQSSFHSPAQQAESTEATILSTCNRTEIYGTGSAQEAEQALHWLAQTGGVKPESLAEHAYTYLNRDAAQHAFRVACGLDSMVLGEPQILGQMKDAVRQAQDAGTLGPALHQLFQRSFAVAKTVRSQTEIGAHSISMAAAAVRLAGQLFEDLSAIRVLFVGAGEMIELAATHFAAKQPKHMAIANRSAERGQALCQRFNAEFMPLADLPLRLAEFDAVVTCTASTLPIIGLGAVERAIKARKHRPMFMVDLAVPRDVEAEVQALDDVYLYTIDDLSRVVQSGKAQRQAAVAEAEQFIEAGIIDFERWLQERRAVPLIQSVHERAQSWQAQEVARVKKRIANGEDIDQALEALAKAMSQKMLHGPLSGLRSADEEERKLAEQAVQRWFLGE